MLVPAFVEPITLCRLQLWFKGKIVVRNCNWLIDTSFTPLLTENTTLLDNHTVTLQPIDLYHAAAILSPRGTKSFVLARLASH